jgi:hypothetical protein
LLPGERKAYGFPGRIHKPFQPEAQPPAFLYYRHITEGQALPLTIAASRNENSKKEKAFQPSRNASSYSRVII